jgi:Zn-dependent protease
MNQGALRLFRFAGIDVFLHWSWFVVALFEINGRSHAYSSVLYNVLEYLALFVIVLLHEFGHALACKQVGGTANRIMLWPLGGVAYVSPPPRAGATLWSIAAGPLVNVLLMPTFMGLGYLSRSAGIPQTMPDVHALLRAVAYINAALLIFNLLPIYPLDGGQILRSLLWFVFGRARSLMIAAGLGLVGVLGMAALAVKIGSGWFGILALYAGMSCWNGLKQARALADVAKLSRRLAYACPSCKAAPPIGPMWKCSSCAATFDTFETQATCPMCKMQFSQTRCLDCGELSPLATWSQQPVVVAATGPQ